MIKNSNGYVSTEDDYPDGLFFLECLCIDRENIENPENWKFYSLDTGRENLYYLTGEFGDADRQLIRVSESELRAGNTKGEAVSAEGRFDILANILSQEYANQ